MDAGLSCASVRDYFRFLQVAPVVEVTRAQSGNKMTGGRERVNQLAIGSIILD